MIICIVGPTGVGKTKLSEILAVKYNAVIVNADAMQVYKKMDIGTAKYKLENHSNQEHFLFDIIDINKDYSVYDYQNDLRKVIKNNNQRNIIIVGGTGFYLKAGLFNYEFENRTPKDYSNLTNEELYDLLKSQNKLEGIHINNRKRMISRLNSSGNNAKKDELLYKNVIFIGLRTDRETLYKKINDRVDEMINKGLLEEVKTLYDDYGSIKPLMTAIGYKELIEFLNNNISFEVAVNLIKKKSRQYAKRQFTWFNNQMNIEWFNTNYEDFYKTVEDVSFYIDRWRSK